ncbi:MAG: hypothetical protein LAP13_10680 [Acidobacteriia bacterium]|nr:hypothetical protein [Terriglobia bacterium]
MAEVQAQVLGNPQVPRPVPSFSVQHQQDVVLGMTLGYFRKEHRHGGGIHLRQNHVSKRLVSLLQ